MIKNVWQYQGMISRQLLRWAGVSIAVGFIMRKGGTFWRQMGGQFIGWGVINAGIALGGQILMRDKVAKMENPGAYVLREKESKNLRQILLINAGLDVLYVLVGRWMVARDKGNGALKGAGWGVILQGAFLMVFDVFHAVSLPEEEA